MSSNLEYCRKQRKQELSKFVNVLKALPLGTSRCRARLCVQAWDPHDSSRLCAPGTQGPRIGTWVSDRPALAKALKLRESQLVVFAQSVGFPKK